MSLKDFSVDELKEIKAMIKAEKKTRKSSANNDARISEVNDLIGKNLLGVGTTVKIVRKQGVSVLVITMIVPSERN